jgi:hypothetical protein
MMHGFLTLGLSANDEIWLQFRMGDAAFTRWKLHVAKEASVKPPTNGANVYTKK